MMGLFSDAKERQRKANLKAMEDKRLAFAQRLDAEGFKPEKMLFAQMDKGGFAAVCAHGGRRWLIVSPEFGGDGDFIRLDFEPEDVKKVDVHIEGEGMGGILGLGRRSQHGAEYVIALPDGGEAVVPFVFGRSSWSEFRLAKNPLLKTARRRGDANVVWELKPIDSGSAKLVLALADAYFLG